MKSAIIIWFLSALTLLAQNVQQSGQVVLFGDEVTTVASGGAMPAFDFFDPTNYQHFVAAPMFNKNMSTIPPTNSVYMADGWAGLSGSSNYNNGSVYGALAPSQINGIIESKLQIIAIQSNGVAESGQFANHLSFHAGVGLCYTNPSGVDDFSSLAMISAEGNGIGQFCIDDRSNGVEYVDFYDVPGGISYGKDYFIKVENTNSTSVNFYLYDSNHSLLTNVMGHATIVGVYSNGFPVMHVYGVLAKFCDITIQDQNGVTNSSSQYVWTREDSQTYKLDETSVVSTNGYFYSKIIGTTVIDYLTGLRMTNATISGYMKGASYVGAIIVRADQNCRTGYALGYSSLDTKLRFYKFNNALTATYVSSNSVTAESASTWYPFTLTASNSDLSFTMNGSTVTATDSDFTNGYVGFLQQGNWYYSNIVVTRF